MSISVDNLAAKVMEALNDYDRQVIVATKNAVEKVAEECRKDISDNAPRDSGKYAKSWKKKRSYYSARETRYTIYSTRYQLTHLLEYGHEKWAWGYYTGGRVPAKPHIRPAEERAEASLEQKIKKELT